jgi:hypothetical protein
MQRIDQTNLTTPRSSRAGRRRGPRPGIRRAQSRARRHGIASLLAMLYMIIFSALALGFYAAVTMANQLAHNDEKAMNAQIATESGLKFIQLQLATVSIPGNTPPNQMMQEVLKDLVAQQGTSENLAGRPITLVGSTIHFPAGADQFVALDAYGAGFRAEITDNGDGLLKVKVHGRYRGVLISRAAELFYEPVTRSTNIFDFGIVTRGPIYVSGGGVIGGGTDPAHGSILSLSESNVPVSLSGTSGIAGDVFMTNPKGTVSISGGGVTIAGESIPALRAQHIHAGVDAPELPTTDSGVFLPYATNPYEPGKTVYTNVIIPPNTNPTFSSDTTIQGVLYIKYPNKVSFNSKTIIRGTVVAENGATPGPNNQISFGGGVEAYGVDTLPTDAVPANSPLRQLLGSTLLAPGFHVTLSGHSGSIGGVMLAHSFEFVGSSGGVINGTFIGLGDVTMKFTGGASIARTKVPGPIPAGLVFSKTFKPLRKTYTEVRP